jgi:hypothetical protein
MMARNDTTLAAFAQFLAETSRDESAVAAAAASKHLAHPTVDALPTLAQTHWRDAARLLKVPADKPVPEKAVASIKSWPAARVSELREHVRQIHAVLEKAENGRLEDEIRDSIRRHYL